MTRWLFHVLFAALFLVSFSGAGRACEFSDLGSAPVVVAGGEDALLPMLDLNLAGRYPFVVFSSMQDKGELDALFDKASAGRIVLVNAFSQEFEAERRMLAEKSPDGWRTTHLIYHERDDEPEPFEKTFFIDEAGEYSVRASLKVAEGSAAVFMLDGKALVTTGGKTPGEEACLDGKLSLSRGGHTFSVKGAESLEASIGPAKDPLSMPMPEIRFTKADPTRYEVQVTGAKGPFTLVFSESYNSGWKAFINDAREAEAAAHLLVNGYANGWLVDPLESDFRMVIEYAPQRRIWAGIIVSAAAFAISALLLVLRRPKKR